MSCFYHDKLNQKDLTGNSKNYAPYGQIFTKYSHE